MYFYILLLFFTAAFVHSTDVKRCESSDARPGLVTLDGCELPGQKCVYKPGQVVNQKLVFFPKFNSDALYVKIVVLGPDGNLTALPLPKVDACGTIIGGCPIKRGRRTVQKSQTTVPDNAHLGEEFYEYKLVDLETDRDIECHRVTQTIIPK